MKLPKKVTGNRTQVTGKKIHFLLITVLSFLSLVTCYLLLVTPVHADSSATSIGSATNLPPDGTWVQDSDVTFAGKSVARAASFVDWTLQNYTWVSSDASLVSYWSEVRNIVYALILLAIFGVAIVMIVTHGSNVTILQLVRNFIVVILLITLSFAIIRFLYQITDIIQGFFIAPGGHPISVGDLLNLSFKYDTFQGYRLSGMNYDEAVLVGVNLVKLTAITYNVMAGMLLLRKVILWFFIIISPVLPLLLLYVPIRNTAKIWIGEFFRWLLYGPVFAILLSGLVTLWKSNISVLHFNFQSGSVYPTAINILLGGPGQQLSLSNSLNSTDAYVQYIVALIMLWIVIILPFLLLRIFLDYVITIALEKTGNGSSVTSELNKRSFLNSLFNQRAPTQPVTPVPSGTSPTAEVVPTGIRSRVEPTSLFPFSQRSIVTPSEERVGTTTEVTRNTTPQNQGVGSVIPQRSIVTAPFTQPTASTQTENQSHIASSISGMPHMKDVSVPGSGNTPSSTPPTIMNVRNSVTNTTNSGNQTEENSMQSSPKLKEIHMPSGGEEKSPKTNGKASSFDYDAAHQMWKQYYDNSEPPMKDGKEQSRKEWVLSQKNETDDMIGGLLSHDDKKIKEVKEKIATNMPHLAQARFSDEEIVHYLRAKSDAAENVLSQLS